MVRYMIGEKKTLLVMLREGRISVELGNFRTSSTFPMLLLSHPLDMQEAPKLWVNLKRKLNRGNKGDEDYCLN